MTVLNEDLNTSEASTIELRERILNVLITFPRPEVRFTLNVTLTRAENAREMCAEC